MHLASGLVVGGWCPSHIESKTLAFYKVHALKFCTATAKIDLNDFYAPFLKELPKGASILDAGCGSGRDTKAFLNRGYRVTAIDLSPDLASIAAKFTGQPCEVLSFQEMNFRNEFDGIWAFASLLHVPRTEMLMVLRRVASAMKPRGVFCVSLKEGCGERFVEDGRFFSYFNAKEFSNFLTFEDRFQIVREWKSDGRNSSGKTCRWINFLAKTN